MNNTTAITTTSTLAVAVVIFMVATLVVGSIVATTTTTRAALAYNDDDKNGNTITDQKNKQDGTVSGFDNQQGQEASNLICTNPSEICVQKGFTAGSGSALTSIPGPTRPKGRCRTSANIPYYCKVFTSCNGSYLSFFHQIIFQG